MISLSLAHGLTGVVQPIEEIAALAKDKGALLHADASYALGKIVKPFECLDYLTFSGDQIHSVKGSGAIFAKPRLPLIPLIPGNQEQDVPSLIALGAAASQAMLSVDTMSLEVARLRDRLEKSGKPLFGDVIRLPNIAVLLFPRVHQEMLQYRLQRKNLFSAIGGTRSPYLHRYLTACGMDEKTAQSAISFHLSRYTTEEEIDRAVALIQETSVSLIPLAEDLF
jgi:cysteine desulfurase